jgi:hypothetical protein
MTANAKPVFASFVRRIGPRALTLDEARELRLLRVVAGEIAPTYGRVSAMIAARNDDEGDGRRRR